MWTEENAESILAIADTTIEKSAPSIMMECFLNIFIKTRCFFQHKLMAELCRKFCNA